MEIEQNEPLPSDALLEDKKYYMYFIIDDFAKTLYKVGISEKSMNSEDLRKAYSNKKENEAFENRIKFFITKFYMLDPKINHINPTPEYIEDILDIYEKEYEQTYKHPNDGGAGYEYYKDVMKEILKDYAENLAVNYLST